MACWSHPLATIRLSTTNASLECVAERLCSSSTKPSCTEQPLFGARQHCCDSFAMPLVSTTIKEAKRGDRQAACRQCKNPGEDVECVCPRARHPLWRQVRSLVHGHARLAHSRHDSLAFAVPLGAFGCSSASSVHCMP